VAPARAAIRLLAITEREGALAVNTNRVVPTWRPMREREPESGRLLDAEYALDFGKGGIETVSQFGATFVLVPLRLDQLHPKETTPAAGKCILKLWITLCAIANAG
jgi:hypothetical protein